MARRRKQQGSLGETIGLLLLAIPVMIWNYIKAHPIEGALIISGIILFICWAIGAKKRRRAAFLKEFYDRSRRLRELNVDDYIDVELTDEITEAAKIGKAVSVGQVNVSFKDLARAYDDVLSSIGIAHGNENIIALQDKGEAITFKYGIKALCDPVKIITEGELKSGYSFYIFPETILVFFEGPEKTVFIAAVDPKALSFSCEDVTIHKQVVVQEKTQNSIRYYDKFCPIPDADIIKSYWKVTNKDGSRSFKGGLLPENNPLSFELNYVKLYVEVGAYKAMSAFSNNAATYRFEKVFKKYNRGIIRKQVPERVERKIEKAPEPTSVQSKSVYDDTFSRTDAKLNDEMLQRSYEPAPAVEKVSVPRSEMVAEPSIEKKINMPESVVTPPVEKKTSNQETTDTKANGAGLDVDSIRYRNREMAKSAVNRLNAIYSDRYDFKVYQVRKAREGWGLQDSGVYTYWKDPQGNQFTIEFDIKTNLEMKKTDLHFSIWGNTRELVAERFKNSVTKGKMEINGEGYTIVIKRSYESMSQAEMTASFEKDTLTLMKLIDMDIISK